MGGAPDWLRLHSKGLGWLCGALIVVTVSAALIWMGFPKKAASRVGTMRLWAGPPTIQQMSDSQEKR
jgi:hypothetical protein